MEETHASHAFRPFRFYDFEIALSRHESRAIQGNHQQEVEDALNDDEDTPKVELDVSSGESSISSDLLDYQMRPRDYAFERLSVWEFIEYS